MIKLIILSLLFLAQEKKCKEILIIKNNSCCLNCFIELNDEFNKNNFTNYSILLYKQNGFMSNLENKEKLKSIFQNANIYFTNNYRYSNIKTPALLLVSYDQNQIINDTILISYEELFDKGIINKSKIANMNIKCK